MTCLSCLTKFCGYGKIETGDIMKVNFVGKAESEIKNIIRKSIQETLLTLNQPCKNLEVCVSFMSLDQIQELNKRTRGIDRATDVLSYPAFSLKVGDFVDEFGEENAYGGMIHLGDMAICLDRAKEQAEEYGTTLFEEVSKLAVHSTLHLMGYDHIEDTDFAIMQPKEDEIRERLINKKVI